MNPLNFPFPRHPFSQPTVRLSAQPCAWLRQWFGLLLILGTIASAVAQDMAIYTDSLQNSWEDWSWGSTINLGYTSNPQYVHGGSSSISVTITDGYAALYLEHADFSSARYTNVTFWVNGGPSGGQSLAVEGVVGGTGTGVLYPFTPTASTWQRITVPLSTLGVANAANFDGIWIQSRSASALPVFYVDDISLGAVVQNSTTISANPTSITADGISASTITVQAKDSNGNNLTSSGGVVALSTTLGSLGSVTDNGDGTYTAVLTATTVAGIANVTGTIAGVTIGYPAAVTFAPGPLNAANTVISANPATLLDNGVSTSTLTVQARDANNNNLTSSVGTVILSTTAGSLSAVTDNGNGTYTATLTSSTTAGTASITGTIAGATIGHPASVLFQEPAVASAANTSISASPASINADGISVSTVTVQAKDSDNNNLSNSGGTVIVSTTAGSLSGVTDNGNGTYTAILTSSTAPGTANITGTIQGATIGHPTSVTFVVIDESILPAIYRTTWNAGIPGGIPADNDPVRPATVWLPTGDPYHGYSVNPALTGAANAAAFSSAFQSAINSAGAAATPTRRKIVLLKAGQYFINPQVASGGHVGIVVQADNVTIRGEGATTTSLTANGTISDYGTVVLFGHRTGSSDASFNVQNVTADALKGSTTIQVANASGYVVGDIITIDHLDGAAAAVGSVYFNGGYLWFYDGSYFKRQPAYSWCGPSTGASSVGTVNNISSANTAAQTRVPQWRSTVQETEITAINGNTLTLKDPLNIDFPLSLSSQVWRTVPLNTASIPVGNRWCGLENIRVAGGNNSWGFPGGCVALSYMAYSWVSGVDADGERWTSDTVNHPGKYGYNIGLGRSYRCVVRESFSHGSTDENPGGQAYGIVVGVGSTACLVEDNISINNNKPIALNETGGGNVIAYNYVDESELWNTAGWLESGIDDCHANFTHNDLIEGNWANNIGSDSTHGNSGWHTHLRNYVNGNNLLGGAMSSNLRAVTMTAWTHYYAFIGNVLMGGTTYQSGGGNPIYQVGINAGYSDNGGADNGYALAHIYRDGNWDNVSSAVVWTNGSKTIPPSFYLVNKPAFFGNYTWPWVDPTGSTPATRVYTLPAKARYDSGSPFAIPPSITSPLTATGTVGVAFNYQITAIQSPTGFNATGLPSGLTVNTGNGAISGTPTTNGISSVTLSASNTAGTGTATLTLTILLPFQSWQMQYFGCINCPQAAPDADPYGKGMSNTNQFLVGLNPINPASVFRVTSSVLTGNDFVLTWQTAGVRTNVVQASNGGADGSFNTNFEDISGPIIISVPGETTTNYTDHGGATNFPSRFYRIRLGP